jgi:AcrR family transcriptional regulator
MFDIVGWNGATMERTLLRPSPARREDGEQTRERLLDTAEELFATQGFYATSIREIVDNAGCNIAAVNYHFRGKENLYLEVMRRRLIAQRETRLAQIHEIQEGGAGPPDLETILESYAHAFIEPLVDRSNGRNLMRLFSRELIEPHLSPELLLTEYVEPVQEALGQAIDSACPNLRPDDVRACIQLFVAQLIHLLHLHRYFADIDPGRLPIRMSPKDLERIVRFSTAGIRSMVRAPRRRKAGKPPTKEVGG